MAHQINKYSKYAQIAQLVEQGTENPRVLGSIPSLGTTYFKKPIRRSTYRFFIVLFPCKKIDPALRA